VSTGSYIKAAAVWCTGHTQDQCVEGPPGTVTATGRKQGRYKVVAAPTIHSWHSDNTAHVTAIQETSDSTCCYHYLLKAVASSSSTAKPAVSVCTASTAQVSPGLCFVSLGLVLTEPRHWLAV
jgi:hypothetical protein